MTDTVSENLCETRHWVSMPVLFEKFGEKFNVDDPVAFRGLASYAEWGEKCRAVRHNRDVFVPGGLCDYELVEGTKLRTHLKKEQNKHAVSAVILESRNKAEYLRKLGGQMVGGKRWEHHFEAFSPILDDLTSSSLKRRTTCDYCDILAPVITAMEQASSFRRTDVGRAAFVVVFLELAGCGIINLDDFGLTDLVKPIEVPWPNQKPTLADGPVVDVDINDTFYHLGDDEVTVQAVCLPGVFATLNGETNISFVAVAEHVLLNRGLFRLNDDDLGDLIRDEVKNAWVSCSLEYPLLAQSEAASSCSKITAPDLEGLFKHIDRCGGSNTHAAAYRVELHSRITACKEAFRVRLQGMLPVAYVDAKFPLNGTIIS